MRRLRPDSLRRDARWCLLRSSRKAGWRRVGPRCFRCLVQFTAAHASLLYLRIPRGEYFAERPTSSRQVYEPTAVSYPSVLVGQNEPSGSRRAGDQKQVPGGGMRQSSLPSTPPRGCGGGRGMAFVPFVYGSTSAGGCTRVYARCCAYTTYVNARKNRSAQAQPRAESRCRGQLSPSATHLSNLAMKLPTALVQRSGDLQHACERC